MSSTDGGDIKQWVQTELGWERDNEGGRIWQRRSRHRRRDQVQSELEHKLPLSPYRDLALLRPV
jgi:hypothetical protein